MQPKQAKNVNSQVCQICGDTVGLTPSGDLFVACNECAFPVCRPCYEYERKDGNQSCPQCKTRYKRHKGTLKACMSSCWCWYSHNWFGHDYLHLYSKWLFMHTKTTKTLKGLASLKAITFGAAFFLRLVVDVRHTSYTWHVLININICSIVLVQPSSCLICDPYTNKHYSVI